MFPVKHRQYPGRPRQCGAWEMSRLTARQERGAFPPGSAGPRTDSGARPLGSRAASRASCPGISGGNFRVEQVLPQQPRRAARPAGSDPPAPGRWLPCAIAVGSPPSRSRVRRGRLSDRPRRAEDRPRRHVAASRRRPHMLASNPRPSSVGSPRPASQRPATRMPAARSTCLRRPTDQRHGGPAGGRSETAGSWAAVPGRPMLRRHRSDGEPLPPSESTSAPSSVVASWSGVRHLRETRSRSFFNATNESRPPRLGEWPTPPVSRSGSAPRPYTPLRPTSSKHASDTTTVDSWLGELVGMQPTDGGRADSRRDGFPEGAERPTVDTPLAQSRPRAGRSWAEPRPFNRHELHRQRRRYRPVERRDETEIESVAPPDRGIAPSEVRARSASGRRSHRDRLSTMTSRRRQRWLSADRRGKARARPTERRPKQRQPNDGDGRRSPQPSRSRSPSQGARAAIS